MNGNDRIPAADQPPDLASNTAGGTNAHPRPVPPAARDHTRVAPGEFAPQNQAPVAPRPHTPAHDAAAYGLPLHPPCPFCAAEHTELHSPFGPQLSVASYWCNDCRTPFELLKWRGNPPHP